VFAEKLLAAGNRYATAIPWYVMTSPLNHDETVAFFRQYDYFGLSSADVSFFAQGLNPVTDGDSKLLLAPDGAILLSPDGHGGVVKALRLAVRAEGFAARGLRHLFYCQVDNPLLAVPDPVFLGAHLQRQSQVSTKVVARQGPQEKMGVACLRAGVPQIVEYSDIDPEAAAATDANGALVLRYGSIAAHLFEIPDLFASEPHLPIHVAHKQQQVLVPADVGEHVQNQTVTKYEQFVFDAIPTCQHSLFLAVDRAEEFAPLKNSTGADSVATCIQGQSDKFRRWLSQCGIEVLATDSHAAPVLVEVAPLYADSVAELQIQLQNSARRSVTRIDENSLFE
jgi:UDP-N-acetylglucosamine/UDP-N-acetylgalactosamine diphosphorylase